MDRQLSCHSYQVTYALIQITELRDLSFIQYEFLQIIQLCAQRKVLLSEIFGSLLNCFAFLRNAVVDSLVVIVELVESFGKILGHIGCLAQHFACESFDLLYSLRSFGLLCD